MTADIRELYQETIIDHGCKPRNHQKLDPFSHTANGNNPLCGDKLTLYLQIDEGIIKAASFEGQGCAIAMASASLLSEALVNKSVEQAHDLFQQFHQLLTDDQVNAGDVKALGKLTILSGVKAFPVRVKCATLVWHTLETALAHSGDTVTTEDPND